MKYIIILFLFLNGIIRPQEGSLSGRVVDRETLKPLGQASVTVEGSDIKTLTDEKGAFRLSGQLPSSGDLIISYIGYSAKRVRIDTLVSSGGSITVSLEPQIISSQTILVTGSIGKEGITPLAFSKVSRSKIEEKYMEQDVPEFLSSLPSTTFYSESGGSIGYNYLSIRGFDQRRISVSINGVPQNDPEDHNVYWLDFPDILSSSELVQVQRGAGSGIIGYPSIGGSINIITSSFSNKAQYEFGAFTGSFNTRKYSANFSSGLIDNTYSIHTMLSKTLSSGYRNSAWADYNAYYVSAVRYDKNLTTQVNFYGGPISDGLAYTGLPKFTIKDKTLRRMNYSYWEASNGKFDYTLERRPEEIENFSQPHFELLNEYNINSRISFNSALFLVLGNGFFDYDGSWADTSYFRLTKDNGFNAQANPSNALIRAQVENRQYGWIPRLRIDHGTGELILGAEFRLHRSLHWGSINYADNLPEGVDKNYRYYQYRGGKDIFNVFAHESYNISPVMNLLAELQLAYFKYRLYDEKYLGTDFKVGSVFLNPRLGLNYKLSTKSNVYLTAARVSREPRLVNYYDAAESGGGAEPQFARNENGAYDFTNPLVKPESMNDLEAGTSFLADGYSAGVNLFYMLFSDEIVKNGKVDRFGQPVTGNMDKTVHSGIELNGLLKLNENFELALNGTYSRNYILNGKTFVSYTDPVTGEDKVGALKLDGNRISGFPDFLLNTSLKMKLGGMTSILTARYVGKFYSDNYDKNLQSYLASYPGFNDYTDNVVDAYFTADIFASYELQLPEISKTLKVSARVNNIFDSLYASYAIGGEFFPAAERNFVVGLQLGL
ncbi:MAG TPA: TonB-dependent receptor [Ignavibacteriales bacterium]|nr:TonB-dependent receptor [Ignavibacteriales bacterium]